MVLVFQDMILVIATVSAVVLAIYAMFYSISKLQYQISRTAPSLKTYYEHSPLYLHVSCSDTLENLLKLDFIFCSMLILFFCVRESGCIFFAQHYVIYRCSTYQIIVSAFQFLHHCLIPYHRLFAEIFFLSNQRKIFFTIGSKYV